jgi:hypothetical protein
VIVVLSCGTDCAWRRWRSDVRASAANEWHAPEQSGNNSNTTQMINPAYAHAIAVEASGRRAAVALGDGRIAMCADLSRAPVRAFPAHSAAASTVYMQLWFFCYRNRRQRRRGASAIVCIEQRSCCFVVRLRRLDSKRWC